LVTGALARLKRVGYVKALLDELGAVSSPELIQEMSARLDTVLAPVITTLFMLVVNKVAAGASNGAITLLKFKSLNPVTFASGRSDH
jgi:hypothetical protein